MSRPPAGELTEMEVKFIEGLKQGMKPTEAARFAGYSCPESQVDRLMARKPIQYAAFKAMLRVNDKYPVYWRNLVEDAKRILHIAMRSGDVDSAIKAACKVLDTAAKLDQKPLAEKVDAEDEATDRQALVDAVNAASRDDVDACPVPVLPAGGDKEH